MKIKFDFGKTKSGDLKSFLANLGDIIYNLVESNGVVFGGCTVYVNFYDENGRIVDISTPIVDKDTGETTQKSIGVLFRNKRFIRNEDTESREYAGKAIGGLYRYWTYDDSYIEER